MKRRRRIILVVTLFSVIIFIIFLICRKGEGTDGRIDAERKQTHKPIEASDISKLPEVSEISEASDSQQTEESSKEPITAAEDLSSETWETSEPEQTDAVPVEPEPAEPESVDSDPVESESAESEPAESESLIPETPEADSSERESEDPVLSEEGSETSVCLHEWIDITETIFHPEQGHYEEIILEEAYDEIRDIVEERRSEKCRCRCGAIFDSDTEWENHSIAHADDEEDIHDSFTVTYLYEEVITGQEIIHHEALKATVWVVDQESWSEERIVERACLICGEREPVENE
ncbi:MAG: hypothetical protein IIY45_02440 [Firmicutes bacterium]|nr:hypothetical protein [Bacillota bacterium]